MLFWERFYNLCLQHNTKPLPVAKTLSISAGSITKWKNGSLPAGETISKIADYFGVTTDYLLGRTDFPTPPAPAPETEASGIDIMISTESKDLSDKDKQEILHLIQYKKRQTESTSPFQSSRVRTTADLEDHTERIAAFGGMEDNDDEPLMT